MYGIMALLDKGIADTFIWKKDMNQVKKCELYAALLRTAVAVLMIAASAGLGAAFGASTAGAGAGEVVASVAKSSKGFSLKENGPVIGSDMVGAFLSIVRHLFHHL